MIASNQNQQSQLEKGTDDAYLPSMIEWILDLPFRRQAVRGVREAACSGFPQRRRLRNPAHQKGGLSGCCSTTS